jgi:hypothetical protein
MKIHVLHTGEVRVSPYLPFGDGGYATKSWKEMITSGVALDKKSCFPRSLIFEKMGTDNQRHSS